MRNLILKCINRECTFDLFYKETRNYWYSVATDLLLKWDHPEAIEADDLVQEMLLAAWKSIGSANPSKGDVKNWVISSAVFAAQKWLHLQRRVSKANINGNGPSKEGHYPIVEARLLAAIDGAENAISESLIETLAIDLNTIEFQENLVYLKEIGKFANTKLERWVVDALLSSFSFEEGAVELMMRICDSEGQGNGRNSAGWSDLNLKNEMRLYKSILCTLVLNSRDY